ncbi:ribosomal RNA small subunit methyltransferase A [Candidatus Micrarchaeota archaeon]|nr:ribosomal RNA small subunit methyltransferase A [Candidatus Micrarchaeota archaeon]
MKQKKSMGQHFLQDNSLLEFEATLANPKGRKVLEIGPGDGRLTEKLLQNSPSSLTVIEKDSEWAAHLQKRFGEEINVVSGDFLEEDFPSFDVVVGNIPYYITSPILYRLAEMDFRHAVLMVQLEVARKMVARPRSSEYGRLSVVAQLFFNTQIVKRVKKGAFSPSPKVDSAIVLMVRKPFNPEKSFLHFLRIIFQHKNQMVKKALEHEGVHVEVPLPRKRARELSPGEIAEMHEKFRVLLQE